MGTTEVDASGETGGSTSDFHLVESHGEWRLTIQVSPQLLAVLTAEGARSDLTPFTVHVEPNLLPSKPFDVAVEPLRSGTADGARNAPERSAR